MDDREREQLLHALGLAQRDQERRRTPPQSWPTSLKRSTPSSSSAREDVAGELLLLVAVRRRIGPAVAAQVEADAAVARVDEAREDAAPDPPVLRPAVHEHDRVAALGTRERHVHAQPARVDVAVLDLDALDGQVLRAHR